MTKKKKIIIAVLFLALLIVCAIIGIKQSYAKSTTQVKGNGIAMVSKWDFKVNGEQTQMKSVSLNSTNRQATIADGKIAPGTSGFFEIIVDSSEAETGISYETKFLNETKKPTNLIFKCGNIKSKNLKDLEQVLKGNIEVQNEDRIKIFTVEWEWPYETGNTQAEINNNDQIDTREGKELTNYTFDISVTGTQMTPESIT